MTRYLQGELVAVNFPFTNLSESKLRPAMVISASQTIAEDDVMITSVERNDGINIEIGPGDFDVLLPKRSFVRCHRITTVEASLIQNSLGKATPEFLKKVLSGVTLCIGL